MLREYRSVNSHLVPYPIPHLILKQLSFTINGWKIFHTQPSKFNFESSHRQMKLRITQP